MTNKPNFTTEKFSSKTRSPDCLSYLSLINQRSYNSNMKSFYDPSNSRMLSRLFGKLSPFLYIIFLIVLNSFQLVTCRQVSNEHSKYQVHLKCADNLMDIQIKLNSIEDKNVHQLNLDKNRTDSKLLKTEHHQTNLTNQTEQTRLELNSIRSMNLTKSINKSISKVEFIKRPIELKLNKTNETNDKINKISQINNLTTNLTNHLNNSTSKMLTKALIKKITKNLINNNSINGSIITDNMRNKRSIRKPEEEKIKILKIYFEGWQDIPHCLPEIIDNQLNKSNLIDEQDKLFHFKLLLQPIDDNGLNCGLMRMRNKITDELDYQHTIIIEYNTVDSKDNKKISTKKDALLVHCKMPKANFFQTNQLLWWSSRIKQQMLDQQWQQKEEQRLLEERLKQTNESDNEQIKQMTRSKLDEKIKHLTFNDQPFGDLNHSIFLASSFQNQHRIKRASQFGFLNTLPANFTESVDELIDYGGTFTGKTPIPKIHIAVRQNGQTKIGQNSSLDVHPGTPLEMIIYLDDESARVYGLLVSFLKVTDNNVNKARQQEEIIILDGCSIDPYIFGNFMSNDNSKSILAKFRAFRFPGSNYVLFVATVNVCIGQCTVAVCNSGNDQEIAYGRRKRRDLNNIYNSSSSRTETFSTALPPSLVIDHKSDFELKRSSSNRKGRKLTTSMQPDVNKVFEVEMTTIISVRKPKQISSMIKNEFRSEDNTNRTQLTKNRLKRPISVRNIRKRYDSNQSLNKLSQNLSFKTSLINSSNRLLNSFFNVYILIFISRFAFLFRSI